MQTFHSSCTTTIVAGRVPLYAMRVVRSAVSLLIAPLSHPARGPKQTPVAVAVLHQEVPLPAQLWQSVGWRSVWKTFDVAHGPVRGGGGAEEVCEGVRNAWRGARRSRVSWQPETIKRLMDNG